MNVISAINNDLHNLYKFTVLHIKFIYYFIAEAVLEFATEVGAVAIDLVTVTAVSSSKASKLLKPFR
jgi:hypothetical protein